ncbi:hypothetical protein GK047_13650 [Paenibacillus sp. SYP-B3998]|uniref:Uncharacterized protein n=1 Tax=Paenibacillus sp. SYP-B3998 TaxID=2678564 RepID=A0A6G3ZZP9_9BACL|nr:hypothetical protein [Paenibacillus sp. SYP-B3998]NEW07051.1 hypothetical protein [Paenibacillus sp. SYP-B3998]
MKRRGFVPIVGIFIILLELSTGAAHAAGLEVKTNGNEEKQVTVVSIPALSFQELQPNQLAALPNLRRLTEHSAIGAMNIRTSNRAMQDVYVTLGAGASAIGVSKAQAFDSQESREGVQASQLLRRYLGYSEHDQPFQNEGQLVVPDITMLQGVNVNQSADAVPGALGDVLKEHHIHRVALGSSDLGLSNVEEKKLRRFGAQMLMDSQGIVDKGAIGEATKVVAVDRPFGVKTDYTQLLTLWNREMIGQKSIVLIELGDLYRLYADQEHYSAARFQELKEHVLQEMDEWIGLIAARMTSQNSLWIFSPEVHGQAAKAKSYLSPTLHYYSESKESLLVSESTRRLGVVTAQDFTVTLLREFNVPALGGMIGLPITSKQTEQALVSLLHDEANMQTVYRIRPLLLYPFVTFEIIVLLTSLLYVLFIKRGEDSIASNGWIARWKRHWRRSVRMLLLSVLTAPVIMLLLGWLVAPLTSNLGVQAAIAGIVILFVIGALLLAVSIEKWRLSSAMLWLGCGTAGIIAMDGSTGAHAMKYSALGYDPMIGARYYGIGNECMGVLIGALVLGVTAAFQRRYDSAPARAASGLDEAAPRKHTLAELETAAAAEAQAAAAKPSRTAALLACAAFLLVTVCLAAPSLGANAGGALSAVVAFGVAGVRCFAGERWRELRFSRGAALLALLLALGLLALWLLNSADSPAAAARESHVGRAFHALREGRFDQIGHLIVRKLRMNVHLIRASVWSKVLITSLFVMAVLVLRPRGRLRLWQHKYPYWMYGFSANMIGAIAALLLNDSGIVAAATLIIYVAVPMLLLRMQEQEASY